MSDDLPDWPRPLYDPLVESDARAELFYLVVGPPPVQPLQVSRARHHVGRHERGLRVSVHRRAEDPAWFAAWFGGALGHQIDGLFARPEELRAAETVTVVRGTFADPPDLNYLRDTVGIVSAIADTPGTLAVFDALAVSWWRLGDWRAAFVDRCEFRAGDHVGTVITEDARAGPGLWGHTRGMAKFARPELEVRGIPGEYGSTNRLVGVAGHVLTGIAAWLAHGGRVRDGQSMQLPQTDAVVTFAVRDDEATRRHFNNAAAEICDFDERTGLARAGAEHLLRQFDRRVRDEE